MTSDDDCVTRLRLTFFGCLELFDGILCLEFFDDEFIC